MRGAAATTLLSLMIAFPGAAKAEAPVMPGDGTRLDCIVSVLIPGALLVQCTDLFAGTVMTVPAGGYWGVLICEQMKELRGCPEVIPTTVKYEGIKFVEKSLNGASVTCTVKGNARASDTVTFACTQ